MRANRSQQGDESAVLPLALASWKLKSKPKLKSYKLIEALPETANARLLVLLRDPTSSLPQLPKVVSIERATLKECSATGLAQNRDGKRRESMEKSYGEQCLGFATENYNRGKYSKYGISCQIEDQVFKYIHYSTAGSSRNRFHQQNSRHRCYINQQLYLSTTISNIYTTQQLVAVGTDSINKTVVIAVISTSSCISQQR
ncbi:hypothetical protein F511_01151 [Dorcoceras hygrometricum]|nr:hypothetical protein F511_01151 [Dorcoceras hygrometricum]